MPWSWCRLGGRQVDVVRQSQRWTEDGREEEGKRRETEKERKEVIP